MTKSELIEILSQRQAHLKSDDVDLAVKALLEMMGGALSAGDRIEIRGFGSFSINRRPPRMGRNPRSGEQVVIPEKLVPHFKPGKALREAVDAQVPLAVEPGFRPRERDRDDRSGRGNGSSTLIDNSDDDGR